MSKETSLAALDNCFTDFSDLIQGFSEDDWEMQSLCPDWDIRGVVTHLAGIENLLLGWVPKSADECVGDPRERQSSEMSIHILVAKCTTAPVSGL